jgi:hypothetical protein
MANQIASRWSGVIEPLDASVSTSSMVAFLDELSSKMAESVGSFWTDVVSMLCKNMEYAGKGVGQIETQARNTGDTTLNGLAGILRNVISTHGANNTNQDYTGLKFGELFDPMHESSEYARDMNPVSRLLRAFIFDGVNTVPKGTPFVVGASEYVTRQDGNRVIIRRTSLAGDVASDVTIDYTFEIEYGQYYLRVNGDRIAEDGLVDGVALVSNVSETNVVHKLIKPSSVTTAETHLSVETTGQNPLLRFDLHFAPIAAGTVQEYVIEPVQISIRADIDFQGVKGAVRKLVGLDIGLDYAINALESVTQSDKGPQWYLGLQNDRRTEALGPLMLQNMQLGFANMTNNTTLPALPNSAMSPIWWLSSDSTAWGGATISEQALRSAYSVYWAVVCIAIFTGKGLEQL